MDEQNKTTNGMIGAHLKDAFQDTMDEGLPDQFRALIDENLKKGVEETLEEGIPDRFRTLLAQLEQAADGGGTK